MHAALQASSATSTSTSTLNQAAASPSLNPTAAPAPCLVASCQHSRRSSSSVTAAAVEEVVNIPEVNRVFREQLEETKRRALAGGGEARLERQHSRGKLSARERLDVLLDPGTFREYDMLKTHRCTDFGMENDLVPGDGVVRARERVRNLDFALALLYKSRYYATHSPFVADAYKGHRTGAAVRVSTLYSSSKHLLKKHPASHLGH